MGKFVHPRSREARKKVHTQQRERRIEEQELDHRAASRQPVLFKLRFFRQELRKSPEKYVYTAGEYGDIVCRYLERCVEVSRDPGAAEAQAEAEGALREGEDTAAEVVRASGPGAGPQPPALKRSSKAAAERTQGKPRFGRKDSEISRTLRRQALARLLQEARQGLLQVPDLSTEERVKDLLVWDGSMKTSQSIAMRAFDPAALSARIQRIEDGAAEFLAPGGRDGER